jgi:hypothetical protein
MLGNCQSHLLLVLHLWFRPPSTHMGLNKWIEGRFFIHPRCDVCCVSAEFPEKCQCGRRVVSHPSNANKVGRIRFRIRQKLLTVRPKQSLGFLAITSSRNAGAPSMVRGGELLAAAHGLVWAD